MESCRGAFIPFTAHFSASFGQEHPSLVPPVLLTLAIADREKRDGGGLASINSFEWSPKACVEFDLELRQNVKSVGGRERR
jgi:hypothetical protein